MIFKCKMCGGTLDVKEGQSIAECEFCGTKQTIPVIDNEKSFNLHNRANALRLRNEFDKAIIVYENILTDNPDDAEAHWGLLLCKYGIEYVDDPLTGKKIPTCHRTQFDSVFSDPDYKAAIKNADVLAREVYETEAKEIDGIQKHILEISQKEERFDVFICYKESDENGRRTIDSVIAQDLYSALTQKGYKVFFSKITLETKLGEMYEPYIFAALNSAKVMLVIGTKEAYFNAVWVRNEWSRFIKIMERDHDKYLIPCYKDMDAYDLPMEMASFQAQDMGKIGFLQDLLYGIDKLFGKTARPVKVEEKPTAVIQNGVNYSALLERAQILIEDGDTKKADSLLEKVLNNDPKNAKAYFYKLLIDLNVKSADELNNFTRRISDEPNYIKACRYADSAMKAELDGYSSRIEENIKRQKQEELYERCVKLYQFSNEKYALEAANGFQKLGDYKDSRAYYERCVARLEKAYDEAVNYIKNYNYSDAACLLEDIKGYKDSVQLIENCCALRNKEAVYRSAGFARYDSVNSLSAAIERLKTIGDYRDSATLIEKYNQRINEIKQREEISKKRKIRFIKIALPIVAAIIAFTLLTVYLFIPLTKYNKAERAYKSGNYDTAIALYDDLYRNHHDFKNAGSKIKQTKYKKADSFVKAGKYTEAEEIFEALGDYKNSADRIYLTKASENFSNGNYIDGINFVVIKADGIVDVTFDTDGGESIPNKKFYGNTRVTSSDIPSAVKVGYTFYEWKISSWEIDTTLNNYNGNIFLRAIYVGSLTYELNGGQCDFLPDKYLSDEDTDLPIPIRTGYDFTGWSYGGVERFWTISKEESGDKRLFANWQVIVYKISYEIKGGEIESVNPTTYTIEDDIILNLPYKTGYNGSWNNNGKISKGSTGDILFTAEYTPIVYTISYDCGDGSNNPLNPTEYTIESDVCILEDAYYINADFVEWQKDGIIIDMIPTGSYGDIALTAIWNPYDVKLELNTDGLTYTVVDLNTSKSAITMYSEQKKITNIADKAFDGFGEITCVVIGKDITSIGAWAFANCKKLKDLTIPNGLTYIGECAFWGCVSITSISIPDTVTYVGSSTFWNCNIESAKTPAVGCKYLKNSSLKEIHITSGVIDDNEFNKSSILSVTIGDDVSSIGDFAFSGCEELTSLSIGGKVNSIGLSAFANCTKLESITWDIENCILEGAKYHNYIFRGCDSIKTIKIGSTVKSIPSSTFALCGGVVSVIIPDNVVSVGEYAFYSCKDLTNVTIGRGVTSIGNNAFEACVELSSITIGDKVEFIGNFAFSSCEKLAIVIISINLISVGQFAFDGCDQLYTVYYMGSDAQWGKITIDVYNTKLVEAIRYYYSESEPALNSTGTAYDGNYWHYDTDGITPKIWEVETYG